MPKVNPSDVKKLREMTGSGIMDVKAALEEAKGDISEAQNILRKKGQAKAAKKSTRETANGLVEAYVHTGKIGVLVEINCETDFVARTDEFKQLAHDLAMHIAAANPLYINKDDVPKEIVNKERQLIIDQISADPKQKQHRDQVVEGKLLKYYEEVCLYAQPFIKDPKMTIEKLIIEKVAKLGENIVVSRFARFELGVSS